MAKRGGFPGGAMPGNMNNLMKQAQRMQRQMEEKTKELEEKQYTAAAGGGAVTVTVSGKKEVVSVFRTNEEGYLITPEQLKCGTYRIEEVEAPENYVQVGFENALLKDGKEVPLNEVADGGTYQEAKKAPITITVDSDTVHQVEEETGKFIVVIEQYNDEAVGSLTILSLIHISEPTRRS